MSSGLRPEQKAAALLVAVGPATASKLIEHLDEDEVSALASEIADLEGVDDGLLSKVVDEVREEAQARAEATGGIDYVQRVLRNYRGGRGSQIAEKLKQEMARTPFRFIKDYEPEQVTQALEDELPQTLALVVAFQPPSESARIMAALDPDVRSDVALRVATMGPVMPQVLEAVESSLESRLGNVSTGGTQGGGARGLAKVLKSSDRETEKAILEGLSLADPDLAEEVKSLMFVFEDIATLDDRSIQRILAEVDTESLAKALKGSAESVKSVILKNMSQRARERLEEELDLMPAMGRKDVDEAQKAVAAVVLQLADSEEIVIKQEDDLVG